MKTAARLPRLNLLPYRQAARRRREQALLWLLTGGALLGLLLGLGAGFLLQLRLDEQARRQDGWRRALQQAQAELAAGQRVQDETAALLARRQAIADLQGQRNAWAHMLEVLARAMPAGVALLGVRQEAALLRLQGHAVAQDQVAALLLALAKAAPASAPELLEVRGAAGGAVEWTIRLAWPASAAPAQAREAADHAAPD